MHRVFGFAALLLSFAVLAAAESRDSGDGRLVPTALEPFEQLIGEWRSHGFLEANKQEGWDEPTAWGWRFETGKIIGMEATFKNGRYFSRAKLDPIESEGQYRFTASTASGNEVVYEGTLKGKNLVLARKGSDPSAPDQVTLQLLHDVRYTMLVEAKKSATLVRKVATIGATRADVRFGAASKEELGPKCIVTGAPGTSTVSFMGVTYYVCCSGCRAEFNHDPEKWLKLAKDAKAKKDGKAASGESAPPKDKSKDSATGKAVGDVKLGAEKSDAKSALPKEEGKGKDADAKSKSAATLLTRGKLMEKNAKRDAAIQAYERLVKDFPKSSEAGEAASRLKELRQHNDSDPK